VLISSCSISLAGSDFAILIPDAEALSSSSTFKRSFAISRRDAPELCVDTLPRTRGRREDRMRAAPAVSCAMCTKRCAHEHTGPAENTRPSLRNGFTAYIVVVLVRRALLPPPPTGYFPPT